MNTVIKVNFLIGNIKSLLLIDFMKSGVRLPMRKYLDEIAFLGLLHS